MQHWQGFAVGTPGSSHMQVDPGAGGVSPASAGSPQPPPQPAPAPTAAAQPEDPAPPLQREPLPLSGSPAYALPMAGANPGAAANMQGPDVMQGAGVADGAATAAAPIPSGDAATAAWSAPAGWQLQRGVSNLAAAPAGRTQDAEAAFGSSFTRNASHVATHDERSGGCGCCRHARQPLSWQSGFRDRAAAAHGRGCGRFTGSGAFGRYNHNGLDAASAAAAAANTAAAACAVTVNYEQAC